MLYICKTKCVERTFHKPSLARMRSSVSESTKASWISGSDRRCDLRLLSPKARETASRPLTLGTSPETNCVMFIDKILEQCTVFINDVHILNDAEIQGFEAV